jgi:lipopolysaccharide transport system permease protein
MKLSVPSVMIPEPRASTAVDPMIRVARPRLASLAPFLNPLAFFRNLFGHSSLIRQFTRREIEARYRGSNLGMLWPFVTPVVMLLIYTFAFGAVFRLRWPGREQDSLAGFALVLFCSLIPFNVFSESVTRAPGLVLAVPNFVKKVVFPLEVLAVSAVGTALFHASVSVVILLGAIWAHTGAIPWTVVLLPLVAIPLIALSLGVTWILASLGVFLRDVGHTVGLAVQVLLFTTPIFFPPEMVPDQFRLLLLLNPLTAIVEDFRVVVLWGRQPEWVALIGRSLVTCGVMLFGYALFMRTKRAFADVV